MMAGRRGQKQGREEARVRGMQRRTGGRSRGGTHVGENDGKARVGAEGENSLTS